MEMLKDSGRSGVNKMYTNNIEGFMFPDEMNWLYETAKGMKSIVEIGAFKGKSTHALLSGISKDGMVYSIDPLDYDDWKDNKVFMEFMRNVGFYPNMRFIRFRSAQAVKMFEDKSIDMVFIDGDHMYPSVKQDIELWLPKTKKLICGHDYHNFTPECEGVTKAVDEMISGFKLCHSIWYKEII
jgi:hypothetical protein